MSKKEIRKHKILIVECIESLYNSIDKNKSKAYKNSIIVNELMRQKRVNDSFFLSSSTAINIFLTNMIKRYIAIYL